MCVDDCKKYYYIIINCNTFLMSFHIDLDGLSCVLIAICVSSGLLSLDQIGDQFGLRNGDLTW